eukprot:TRINITY_DN9959_c0_g1_i2.p1 TRINITY_DN9959_c0_g1~~TRINITY_DN9959_c0_g1_i2.p1  ORF type:complete len:179 (-),score=44.56 TRINITY_DN9959_c0_g1_i2:443-955(-)
MALFNTSVYNEDLANLYVRSDGKIGVGDKFGADNAKSLVEGKWHFVTATVDCNLGVMSVYVDGNLNVLCESKQVMKIDGDYALKERICLFGSKDKSEIFGGNLRFFQLDTKVLDPSDVLVLYETTLAERSWKCRECTVINPGDAVQCTVCGAVNASVVESHAWSCLPVLS